MGHIPKNMQKNKCVCFHETIDHNENGDKNEKKITDAT